MYRKIADDLHRRIEAQEFTANTPMPTETDLQAQYGASRNTVREAVKLLVLQHLIETRPGQGMFVIKKIVPFVITLSTDPRATHGSGGEEAATYPLVVRDQDREAGAGTPVVTVLKCPAPLAARLKIDPGQRVVSRRQPRFIDGTIWSLQASYYPLDWVQRGAVGLLEPEDIPEGAVQHLAMTIGLKQVGYRDLVSARLSNDIEQELFSLPRSHTVIEVTRTSYAEDETPIRVAVTVFPSDRNQIAYNLGTVPDCPDESH
jgi:GntR family transcriptional regulator